MASPWSFTLSLPLSITVFPPFKRLYFSDMEFRKSVIALNPNLRELFSVVDSMTCGACKSAKLWEIVGTESVNLSRELLEAIQGESVMASKK